MFGTVEIKKRCHAGLNGLRDRERKRKRKTERKREKHLARFGTVKILPELGGINMPNSCGKK